MLLNKIFLQIKVKEKIRKKFILWVQEFHFEYATLFGNQNAANRKWKVPQRKKKKIEQIEGKYISKMHSCNGLWKRVFT